MTDRHAARPGEQALPFDPAERADAGIAFIGRLRTPWSEGDCPRNLARARERGGTFAIELDAPYRAGLAGLETGRAIVVLYWMSAARRDLIVQNPRHGGGLRGTFALRSPVRPNPVSMAVTTILDIDPENGRIAVEALDCFDGTPLVDIKPWSPGIDIPPGA